ncbi:hypothetical protein UFOVP222_98 [uncultured Caudovirales phage]|uniref:Uncharacterized protein n=1 Tax=uncultured Caudovirales phage TaxID=2100421 RepID=A0A6J7WS55_9CAUD|nr:hypothetical protein UFOVP108_93 [uncultured Caudovirales phage]CAB5219615.1 hypothetical protein UFOVP222_98 [uncultured Caudovirales phage]
MKKVISFCLFGKDPRYTMGAIINAKLAQKYMPDWECRFYVAKNVPEEIVDKLNEFNNVKIIQSRTPFNFTFTLERFKVFSDPEVDIAICRDTDGRISGRDILCINEWLEDRFDKLNFHIIKDHPHGHSAVMSAGMWGAKAKALRDIEDEIEHFLSRPDVDRNQRGVDQEFLAERIHLRAIDSVLYHSNYYTNKITGDSISKNFPSLDRYPDNHIGAAVDENDEYVYAADREPAISKNGNAVYIYDFDLLEKND